MTTSATSRLAEARALLLGRAAAAHETIGACQAALGRQPEANPEANPEAHTEARPEALALEPGLHEWFAENRSTESARTWLPPLAVLLGLAWHAIEQPDANGSIVWIGRRAWPSPLALLRHQPPEIDRRLFGRSLFVEPASRDERVWAIEQAARSPGVALVIADGSRLRMPESRRLQLAAADHCPILLARPPGECNELSAARTRWRVRPRAEPAAQAWTVELLRCKGSSRGTAGGARPWVVRREHAFGSPIATVGPWQACHGDLAANAHDRPDHQEPAIKPHARSA